MPNVTVAWTLIILLTGSLANSVDVIAKLPPCNKYIYNVFPCNEHNL